MSAPVWYLSEMQGEECGVRLRCTMIVDIKKPFLSYELIKRPFCVHSTQETDYSPF